MINVGSVPIEEFESFYSSRSDPYDMHGRWYEERKRALTVAALSQVQYPRGEEVAAGEGALTRQLAPRCRELLATDGSTTAVQRASRNLRDLHNVTLAHHVIPEPLPGSNYDLAVVAEVGYFLGHDDLLRMLDDLVPRIDPGGELLAVHWRHSSEDYPGTGQQVHEAFHRDARLKRLNHHEDSDFLLDSWIRVESATPVDVGA